MLFESLEVRAPKPLGSLIPTIEVNKYKRPLVLTLVAQLTDTALLWGTSSFCPHINQS
jgi:hypothetical protein